MTDIRHEVPHGYSYGFSYKSNAFTIDEAYIEVFVKVGNGYDEQTAKEAIETTDVANEEWKSYIYKPNGYQVTNWGWAEYNDGSVLLRILLDPHTFGKQAITAKHAEGSEKIFAH